VTFSIFSDSLADLVTLPIALLQDEIEVKSELIPIVDLILFARYVSVTRERYSCVTRNSLEEATSNQRVDELLRFPVPFRRLRDLVDPDRDPPAWSIVHGPIPEEMKMTDRRRL
jgi:hypothetical protein